ncbi:cytochrome b [Alteromonadaceae bacterium BrNp21-10]|nr:cytochrome b [Alteromonadaceae bacterium BrNp21-10]
MRLANNQFSFGWVSIVIHWLSAITIVGLFAVGWWMVDLDYYSEWYQTAPHWHVSVGILLCLVTVFRLIWRWCQPSPKGIGAKWEQIAAFAAHTILYLLLFVLFTAGYLLTTADGRGIEVFNWFTLPSMGELFEKQEQLSGDIHEFAAYGLIALALIHALAAFKHHFINKDETLNRMLKPSKQLNGDNK